MSAKRLSSKVTHRNVRSVGSSENLKVVLPERKDSTSRNLLTATTHRLFSKSCKNEKENVSRSRSKPEMNDKCKESKSCGRHVNGALCPVTTKNGNPDSLHGGRKAPVLMTTETPGRLSNRSKPEEKKPSSLLNCSKQNAESSVDVQINSSKLSQQGLEEPKLHSTSEHPTSKKLVERVNGVNRITVERHSTKSLASKSKILSDISQNRLHSTSVTSSSKKLPVKPACRVVATPLNINYTPSESWEVGESLKLNVPSLTKNTKPHSTVESDTLSASQNAVNCGCHVVKILGHNFPGAATRTDSSLDSINNLSIADSSKRDQIDPRETEHNVKNGSETSATARFDATCISAGSNDSSSSTGSNNNSSSTGSNANEIDGMCSMQKQFTFDPATCEILEDDCLDKTMTEQRDEGDFSCEDPFADVTLISDSAESDVFVELPFANYFKCRQDRTESSRSCWSDERSFGSASSVSRSSGSSQESVSEESNIPDSFVRKTLLRRTRQLLSLDSRHSGRSQSTIFAALGGGMPDPRMEEPRQLRCSDRTCVGESETESDSATNSRNCGAASGGCSKELDALSGPETGWSTGLHNYEKNIPLSSFVPYAQRLSMLPDHMASHPLDMLTDPGRKTPDRRPDCSETLGFSCAEVGKDGAGRPAKPLVQLSLSSDSETVHGSHTSSESNLQSLHERISFVDLMPPGFESAKALIERESKDIHGLMSTHFLPRRPLSQICSRTINASNIGKIGNAPAEGLPHHHAPNSTCCTAAGNPWKSACNISAQIRAARSCSQRSFSPLPTIGADIHERLTFPRPSDLPSAGSSVQVSSASASTIGQASSFLETSPTHRVFNGAANPAQIENGVRSRLSSFDRDFHLSTSSSRSRSSSFVSSVEEKQAGEIRRLRRELELAKEEITSLMTQLNMNVVLATTYEQNLESMSQRHQHLATLLQEKSMELQVFRSSVIKDFASCDGELKGIPNSVNLQSSRRMSSSFSNFSMDSKARESSFCRQISSDSLNSQSSSCSAASQPCSFSGVGPEPKKKSKKNWIKKSLSRAFSGKHKRSSYLMVEPDAASVDLSHSDAALEEKPSAPVREMDSSDRTFHEKTITDLKRQLSERDAEVMDLKLDALSSVQQKDQLRATVVQLKKEIASLQAEQTGVKRQLVKPGQTGPSSTVSQALYVVPTGSDSRKASIVSGADLAMDSTTSRTPDPSVDLSIDGYPRLTSQESFIFSSPKFLHKFSLKSAITSVSIDDCLLPVKPSNPSGAITRTSSHRECRRKDYDRNKCRLDPKTTRSVDTGSPRSDSEGSSSRKTSSPLTTASRSPSSTSSETLRRNNMNGCPKSRNSTLLQSAV